MYHQAVIESLSEKIDRLIAENERLRKEGAALQAERDSLRSENREHKLAMGAQENRIRLLELGEGLKAASGDTRQARARINRLMREIDRCIALMNR